MRISVIICAHNEARYLSSCLYSLLAQSRPPEEILVINNASTDATGAVAAQVPGVRVVDEPRKGLVVARETGRHSATGDLLVYIDADCRAPLTWLALVERRFERDPRLLALSGPYRFYDWDWPGGGQLWCRVPGRQALVHGRRDLRRSAGETGRRSVPRPDAPRLVHAGVATPV